MTSFTSLARRFWYVLLAVFVLAIFFSVRQANLQNANGDPYIYWAVGAKFLNGQPLYTPVPGSQEFLYPPVAVLFCQVLALMPFPTAVGVLTLLNFMAWLALLWYTYRFLSFYFPGAALQSALLVGTLATIRYFWHNIVWVNSNELVALASIGGLYMYLKGRQTTGLGLLTLATWVKVMPLLLIGILFIRRPGHTSSRVLIFSTLFAIILCGFRGINQGLQDYLDYWHSTFRPFLLGGKVFTEWIAFGVSATLSKLLTAHPDMDGVRYHIVSWPPALVGKISLVIRLILVSTTYYYGWKTRSQKVVPLVVLLATYLTMLLVAGVSWEGHHVTLLLVIAGLYQCLTELGMLRLRRWLALISLGVGLMTSDLLGGHWSDYVQAFSLITYNVIFLFVITVWVNQRLIKEEQRLRVNTTTAA